MLLIGLKGTKDTGNTELLLFCFVVFFFHLRSLLLNFFISLFKYDTFCYTA